MMKRMLAAVLLLCLALSLVPVAQASVYARTVQYVTPRTGPGQQYMSTDIRLGGNESVQVRSRAWDADSYSWWVQIEFGYGYDKVRAYVPAAAVNVNLNVLPEEEILRECFLIFDADAFAGPRYEGALGWSDTITINTRASLLEVDAGYGHIDCWNPYRDCMWRAWVDLDTLDCGSLYGGGSYHSSEEYPYAREFYYGNGPLPTPMPQSSTVSSGDYYVRMYGEYLPYIPAGGITPNCSNKDSIKWVQQALRRLGYGELAVDGKWGESGQTANAVAQFQRDLGFTYVGRNVVNYDMAVTLLTLYVQNGQPLSYLQPYCR